MEYPVTSNLDKDLEEVPDEIYIKESEAIVGTDKLTEQVVGIYPFRFNLMKEN